MEGIDLSKVSVADKDVALQMFLAGNSEDANAYLQKTMSSVKDDGAKDVIETIGGPRSLEAQKLAEKSHGKIVLRPDGKIDFPELGIKGMGRLSVEGATDLDNGLVQGGYQGGGIRGLSYMTGKRAMEEVGKQGKKLFPASEAAAKTSAFLATLGKNGAEQSKALQALFGSDSSGCWNPDNEKWNHVGSVSCLGLSEVSTNGRVSSVDFDSVNADQDWYDQGCPQPFLACEDC